MKIFLEVVDKDIRYAISNRPFITTKIMDGNAISKVYLKTNCPK